MSVLSVADTAYAIRFLRLLTMPFEKTQAYKLGVIDKKGQKIKKPESSKEKSSYTIFHRLVFNIRKLLLKVPGIGGTVTNYLAALFLIKEHTGMTDKEIKEVLDKAFNIEIISITENNLFINNDHILVEGTYILNKNLLLPTTGEELVLKGTEVIVKEGCESCGTIFKTPVFKVYHPKTKNYIYVTQEELKDV